MPSITQTSLSVYRDNILVLDIYFEALNYETIEQKKAYELAGLLGKEAVQFAFRIDDMRRDRCFLPEVTSACNFYDRRSVPRRYKTASFMYFAAHLQVLHTSTHSVNYPTSHTRDTTGGTERR